jgi:diguanylate cyclase (GGDEF)-like protein
MKECIARTQRQPGYKFAVLFLDIDNFKLINDSLGHDYGDQLIVQVAGRLRECVRSIDTVMTVEEDPTARIGGDEFVVLLDGVGDDSNSVRVAERIFEQLSLPFDLSGHEVTISTSIGITVSTHGYTSAKNVLRDADTAMYRAKAAGKARYAMFDQRMHETARARLTLENDMRRALENDQFFLLYQPIVLVADERIVGVEALIRWDHPERRTVEPGDFITVAEESGLIIPIGNWTLREACAQVASVRQSLGPDAAFGVSVNLSRRELLEKNLVSNVALILKETGLDARHVNLEITESAIIRDADEVRRQLEGLRQLGVGMHMDDFGTGYSSLSCLHSFPLDVVKIDREFTVTMEENEDYAAVVEAIVTLAHRLNLRVIVEGIESKEQFARVKALGCDFAQGYLFSPPVKLTEILKNLGSVPAQAQHSSVLH